MYTSTLALTIAPNNFTVRDRKWMQNLGWKYIQNKLQKYHKVQRLIVKA
jgi:hypothetical protein